MVEKRVFDTLLANTLRSEPSIRIISLIDREGLPISFAIKSRKYKIKPNTLGATMKQAYYPMDNYAKNLKLKKPLVQIYLLEEASVLLINLGVAILSIVFDCYGWPLQPQLFNRLFQRLKPKLEKAYSKEDGLLSKITGEKEEDLMDMISEDNISKILQILQSLSLGEVEQLLVMDSAPAPEIFTNISEKFDAFTVDGKNNILSMNPNYGPEFVACTKETLDIELSGLQSLKAGEVLCGLSYFANGHCIVNGVMGEYNKERIYGFKIFKDWSIGFKKIISPLYAIVNYLVADFASELSMNFIDMVIYYTDSVESLKERINSYVKDKDFTTARRFMERAAILSVRNEKYLEAGDLYKWMGFTLYKEGEAKKAIKIYDLAAKNHEAGKDLEKAGEDYQDIANILMNLKKESEAIQYYNQAEQIFRKAGLSDRADEVQEAKDNLLRPYYEQFKQFIKQSSSETLTIDYFIKKFKLSEELVVLIIKKLIQENEIEGEVDVHKGRYTKRRISTGRMETQAESAPSGVSGTTSINLNYSELRPKLNHIETSLSSMEKKFETMNIPFLKYVEYEKMLDQKQFLEHKRRIIEEKDSFFDAQNNNLRCFICFKPLDMSDDLSECPNGHKAHQSCLSIWIKSQDACPVCDAPFFPYVLRTTFKDVNGSIGTKAQNEALLTEMKQKMAKLSKEVERLQGVNQTLKEMKGDNNDYVDKIMRERELKGKLQKELKRRELTIRELKSMIKLFKQ
ncbi:MAG: hypothetical protein GF364_10755 [Candidatus Lokiarchaeota archaeon]|nr:hypothetical protein [Candidatus Lokiarchaeota archaeon]